MTFLHVYVATRARNFSGPTPGNGVVLGPLSPTLCFVRTFSQNLSSLLCFLLVCNAQNLCVIFQDGRLSIFHFLSFLWYQSRSKCVYVTLSNEFSVIVGHSFVITPLSKINKNEATRILGCFKLGGNEISRLSSSTVAKLFENMFLNFFVYISTCVFERLFTLAREY